ncbi:hypothetical protein E1292_28225 [Nonomuraea deserti]|uniref:Uncharacterized protein n=1 Tax=Nonomuraea deserti TaxID=1848322 RepID=A0A4R4VDM0_9ACTN|nr:hypothetical protein [Nonomuraea deserti]TDD00633.1 hypothetical protein E1292_28225 [Nonomuraea deserti]
MPVGVLAVVAAGMWLLWWLLEVPPDPVAELRAGQVQTVRLDREGLAIYREPPNYATFCEVKNSAGQAVELDHSPGPSTTAGGKDWVVTLTSEDPVPPGTYTITCGAIDDSGTFAVGPGMFRLPGVVEERMDVIPPVIIIGALLVAGTSALVIFIRRRRAAT